MQRLRNYPCCKCKKLTNGVVFHTNIINDNLYPIKNNNYYCYIKTDCCNTSFIRILNEYDYRRYIYEVENE